MRTGRGNRLDHDQKSVEPPRKLSGFRNAHKETKVISDSKQCPKCTLWFPRIAECFDLDSRDEFQSYCVECKDSWELTPESHFRRLRSWLMKNEPQSWAAWDACAGGAWAEFLRKLSLQSSLCHHCGAGLREWQYAGHCLDRRDNGDRTLHTPQNTVFACAPCNMARGRKRWFAWEKEAAARVAEHGWGQVPHGEYDDRFNRVVRRRCKHLAVAAPQMRLAL